MLPAALTLVLLLSSISQASQQAACTQPDSFVHISFDDAMLVRSKYPCWGSNATWD